MGSRKWRWWVVAFDINKEAAYFLPENIRSSVWFLREKKLLSLEYKSFFLRIFFSSKKNFFLRRKLFSSKLQTLT